jgi:hypothetical protein
MAHFTTRIELYNANLGDYIRLHKEMEMEKFSRIVVGDKGIKCKLPTGEYDKAGNFTIDDVLECAKRASVKVGKRYSVLVTEANSRIWFQLEAVKTK